MSQQQLLRAKFVEIKEMYDKGIEYEERLQELDPIKHKERIDKLELLASECFINAGSQGHADAQCRLATRYLEGRGVPVDRAQAMLFLKKADLQGHEGAKCYLNIMNRNLSSRLEIEAIHNFCKEIRLLAAEIQNDVAKKAQGSRSWALSNTIEDSRELERLANEVEQRTRKSSKSGSDVLKKDTYMGPAHTDIWGRLFASYHLSRTVPGDESFKGIEFDQAMDERDKRLRETFDNRDMDSATATLVRTKSLLERSMAEAAEGNTSVQVTKSPVLSPFESNCNISRSQLAEQYRKLGWYEEAKRLLLMKQSEPESEADRQLLQVLEAECPSLKQMSPPLSPKQSPKCGSSKGNPKIGSIKSSPKAASKSSPLPLVGMEGDVGSDTIQLPSAAVGK